MRIQNTLILKYIDLTTMGVIYTFYFEKFVTNPNEFVEQCKTSVYN